jgi:hypothetical protein
VEIYLCSLYVSSCHGQGQLYFINITKSTVLRDDTSSVFTEMVPACSENQRESWRYIPGSAKAPLHFVFRRVSLVSSGLCAMLYS